MEKKVRKPLFISILVLQGLISNHRLVSLKGRDFVVCFWCHSIDLKILHILQGAGSSRYCCSPLLGAHYGAHANVVLAERF
jgi:hypothetical protein